MDIGHKELIEENPVALSSINKDGSPNVIGVAYVKVVSDESLIITDNYMSQTKRNIENNGKVCLAVWDKAWNGVKIIGKAKYFNSGKWLSFVKGMSENKGLPAKGAILVEISKIIKLS